METDPIQIAILAPTLAVRVGLRTLLSASDLIEVCAEAANFDEIELEWDQVDVVVFQGDQILEGWQPTASGESHLTILGVTTAPQVPQTLKRFSSQDRINSWGVVSPEADADELVAAVVAVDFGFIVAPPDMLVPLWGPEFTLGTTEIIEALTPRETEVLQLLAQGLANKQIALELDISEHTVKFHISSIYGKLGATNRTEAVRLGLQQGLILL
jgi:DNA-binding NarL/FixJ family response regulator